MAQPGLPAGKTRAGIDGLVMDEHLPAQIARGLQRCRGQQRRGAHGVHLLVHQLLGRQPWPLAPAIAHAHVDALGHKVHRLQAGVQPQIGLRPGGLKALNARKQPLGGKRRAHSHREHAARAATAQALQPHSQTLQPCANIRQGLLRHLRGHQPGAAAGAAHKQRAAQPVFQRAHQLAHRRRGHVQLLRRQRKTLVPGTGFKGTQGVEVGY